MSFTQDAPFPAAFESLAGHPPFPWQAELHRRFLTGRPPRRCDIPTGLGKTAVMAVWLIARTQGAALPRRLVYVVDRRAVVDQASRFAEQLRERAAEALGVADLPISTLRGKFVDNRRWLEAPEAESLVVGTVDMIGSRLLFSGYGVSRRMRPYQAGLLGADTLLVLDEAHLCPPFEALLTEIEQQRDRLLGGQAPNDPPLIPPFRLLSLSATGREPAKDESATETLRLTQADLRDAVVARRLTASKRLTLCDALSDQKTLVTTLAARAFELATRTGPARVLVYCQSPDTAMKIKAELEKRSEAEPPDVQAMVGGRRIKERENLQRWLTDTGFMGDADGPPARPTLLVATSAGEVGVDLDADHLVCDLVEWERMVQRLGRVNRRGAGDAVVEVHPAPQKQDKEEKAWTERLARLRRPLELLPCDGEGSCDVSPGALDHLKRMAEGQTAVAAATTPAPLHPALTRSLVEAWSLTTLKTHSGRPEVAPWLRGWVRDEPRTTVVWRRHMPVRYGGPKASTVEIEAFFEAAPPHVSEGLETEASSVAVWLKNRVEVLCRSKARAIGKESEHERDGTESPAWPSDNGDVVAYLLTGAGDLQELLQAAQIERMDKKKLETRLADKILVLDWRVGGLRDGRLDAGVSDAPACLDDGEPWMPAVDGQPVVRFRVRALARDEAMDADGDWRPRRVFATELTPEGEPLRWLLVEKWRHDAATEDDRSTGYPQTLEEHQDWTERRARRLAATIGLSPAYVEVLALAARLHDEGKRHRRWQRAAAAPRDGRVYAKTGGQMKPAVLDGYRHELGSLPCVEMDPAFRVLPVDLQDLVLHLVVAHHGWGRPTISIRSCDDAPPSALEERARQISLRFVRLQKRWGPWGLAWWEALLRAADQQASRENDARASVVLPSVDTDEVA